MPPEGPEERNLMLVARHLWQQLGLQEIIDSLVKKDGDGRELALSAPITDWR